MKFSIKDFFSKWSHLLNKSLMESFIFCAVIDYIDYIFPYMVVVVELATASICHNVSYTRRASAITFLYQVNITPICENS